MNTKRSSRSALLGASGPALASPTNISSVLQNILRNLPDHNNFIFDLSSCNAKRNRTKTYSSAPSARARAAAASFSRRSRSSPALSLAVHQSMFWSSSKSPALPSLYVVGLLLGPAVNIIKEVTSCNVLSWMTTHFARAWAGRLAGAPPLAWEWRLNIR